MGTVTSIIVAAASSLPNSGISGISVVEFVGVGVGSVVFVGVGVGSSDGVGVGSSEGVGVGSSDGVGVGSSDGVGVGSSEGVGVGSCALTTTMAADTKRQIVNSAITNLFFILFNSPPMD